MLVGGTLSWIGLIYTGVHAALALVPEELGGMLKLGALLSFAAGPLALIVAKMMRVQKMS